ncbi:putative thioesterase BOA10 [Colletotrichum sidae]|uniref:Putative thioesterase BOA10 n=1 Tax=Colletotrichum sidae TaxID=1347389 RepID=A0A4R8T7E1_9PEZI|nr:putative thioesterase BOA10 [Colletotrichum sidae]
MVIQKYPTECEVVQPATPRGLSATPLFLFHDGGGTTFAYHCLASLDRAVFGIASPRFHSATAWEGGLPEMARVYLRMIRNTILGPEYPPLAPFSTDGTRRRKILLGGWSLGGLLALEIARLLVTGANALGADEDGDDAGVGIEIVGLVFIDSIYPVWPAGSEAKLGTYAETAEPQGKNQKLAKQAMKLAAGMVKVWQMPRCGAAIAAENGAKNEVQSGHDKVERSFYGSREERETREVVWERPPRGVLVKATDGVPMPGDGISPTDVYRSDEKLGWDEYCPGFIEKTLMTSGSHFDMFSWGYTDEITARVADACQYLEGSYGYEDMMTADMS